MYIIKTAPKQFHVNPVSLLMVAGLLFWQFTTPASSAELTKTDPKAGIIITVVAEQGTIKQPVPLNKLTNLTITFTDMQKKPLADISDLTFDARMPDHNHGMVVKPQLTMLKEGVFVVKGVKLHMPGKWKLILDFRLKKDAVKQVIPYELKVH